MTRRIDRELRSPDARRAARLVLLAGAVAALMVSAVLLLPAGGSRGVPRPKAKDADARAASRPVVVPARIPVVAPPSEDGAGAPGRAAVEGRVRDGMETLLAGVRITARLLGQTATSPSHASTGAQGSFALELPADAMAELAFSCAGHRPQRAVECAPARLDVVLERAPTLRGRVVRVDGTSVGGASVRWSNPRLARGAGGTTTTGADGRFAFGDVPWSLDLEVLAPDALPAYRSVQVTWDLPELVVTVDAGREATGTVVDAQSGAGIAGASVSLWYYASTYTSEGRRAGP